MYFSVSVQATSLTARHIPFKGHAKILIFAIFHIQNNMVFEAFLTEESVLDTSFLAPEVCYALYGTPRPLALPLDAFWHTIGV